MLRIHTLGGLTVRDDGAPLAGAAAQPRRMALLALLARAGARGLTRERAIALLWPDFDDERGGRALSQALYTLRRDLGAPDAIAGLKELRLDPAHVTTDLADWDRARATGALEAAAELYAGPFLDGFHVAGAEEFERWVEDERRALAAEHAAVLERLARQDAARGDAAGAARRWQRLASADPLNARVAVALMEALAAAGDRAGAVRHARVYEALLAQSLDLPPDREVVALAERLRREADVPAPVASPVLASAAVLPPTAAPTPVGTGGPATATRPVAPSAGTTAATHPLATDATAPWAVAPAALPGAGAPSADAGGLATPLDELNVLPNATAGAGLVAVRGASPTVPGTPAPVLTPSVTTAPPRQDARRRARHRATIAGLALIAVGVAAATVVPARGWQRASLAGGAAPVVDTAVPVLAVGRIAAVAMHGGTAAAPPVGDLLSVGLARAAGLRVVSAARIAELLPQTASGRDSSAGGFTAAARRAGATLLVDGTLYLLPGGRLRLDLRRTDLASGDLRGSETVQGTDAFAVVDSGTARVLAQVGHTAEAGSVADVTTHSLVAYRLYTDGLARAYGTDNEGAVRLFAAALAEDSTFTLAAYALARTLPDAEAAPMLARAVRLAAAGTDRERLVIRTGWALRTSAPEAAALAETLATRYPDEVEAQAYRGAALMAGQQYLAALAPLRRAVAMDSAALGHPRQWCGACEAMQNLVWAYTALDSFPAAEREARRFARLRPGVAAPWFALTDVLDAQDRSADAAAAIRQAAAVDPDGRSAAARALARHYVRTGEYAAADRQFVAAAEGSDPAAREDAWWFGALSARQQGRLGDALRLARAHRPRTVASGGGVPPLVELEAQLLLESGRPAAAAALYDSVAHWHGPGFSASAAARNRAWSLTHAADARAAAGDTGALPRLAAAVQAAGAGSLLGRDRQLYHHVQGLLLAARGRDAEAVAEFRAAIGTPTWGYTRSNVALAAALGRLGRPAEAVPVLQAALRGPIDGSNLYVSRTELHARLADAWAAAGRPDSASAHARVVARDWAAGDAPYAARAALAARLTTGTAAPTRPSP